MNACTITRNPDFNSLEITFDEKPAEAIRAALKSLKFRWHSVKKVWYGYASEETTRKALEAVEQCEAVAVGLPESKTINEGTIYEGWEGGNAHQWHTDAELKALLLADFKRAGIKATVRQNRAGYLTSITTTVTIRQDEVKPFEQWRTDGSFRIMAADWLYYTDEAGKLRDIYGEKFFSLDPNDAETVELRENIIRTAYRLRLDRLNSTGHDFTDYSDILQPAALARVETVKAIVASYNRDESNSQIDYFDRSIYDHYAIKIA